MSSLPTRLRPPAGAGWRYSRTAVVLHWLLALLIVLTAAIGWRMTAIEDEPGAEQFFELHKSIGLVIAALVAARVLWRLSHRPEPLPGAVPAWQVRLATITHALLYALMVLMPITGYLGASYSKEGVAMFGLATPRWTAPDHDLAEQFFAVHSALVWVLVAAFAVHALGVLKHLLLDHDNQVFERMWFGPRR